MEKLIKLALTIVSSVLILVGSLFLTAVIFSHVAENYSSKVGVSDVFYILAYPVGVLIGSFAISGRLTIRSIVICALLPILIISIFFTIGFVADYLNIGLGKGVGIGIIILLVCLPLARLVSKKYIK